MSVADNGDSTRDRDPEGGGTHRRTGLTVALGPRGPPSLTYGGAVIDRANGRRWRRLLRYRRVATDHDLLEWTTPAQRTTMALLGILYWGVVTLLLVVLSALWLGQPG
jgi:hypothetical protein